MRIHEEHERGITALNHQLERLSYELEYLRGEDRRGNLTFS